ncbi:MAG: hypothetical protein WBB76_10295 [Gaiellaceae bacterium]
MRRLAAVLGVLVLLYVGAYALRRGAAPPSPYCSRGSPLAGVYHPSRLKVKSPCRVAIGTVSKVKFEAYDGDVHVDLRLDPGYESLLSDGNARVGGNLVVEIIPQDRARVAIPREGQRVEVVGPWVDDTKHGWNEIHPAWWVSAGAIEPASAAELRRVQLLLQGVEGAAEEDDG